MRWGPVRVNGGGLKYMWLPSKRKRRDGTKPTKQIEKGLVKTAESRSKAQT